MSDDRISREKMYFEIARTLRKRSTCLRGKVGVVAVKDKRIIATGYNGAPPGQPHCLDLGCDVDANNHDSGCQRTVHAESALIAFSARHGIALENSELYSTHAPCLKCAQLIGNAGIVAVHYLTPYRLTSGVELLEAMLIQVTHWQEDNHHPFQPRESGRMPLSCLVCGRTKEAHALARQDP